MRHSKMLCENLIPFHNVLYFYMTLVIWLTLFMATLCSDDTVRTSSAAVLDTKAKLPCDVRSSLPKDRPVLILWYKDSAGTPIYSFDAREIELKDGKHWVENKLLGDRAYFVLHHYTNHQKWTNLPGLANHADDYSNFGAYLELTPALKTDEAVYRCRVDFRLSPTRNTLVNFTVIIPPDAPKIYNEAEDLVEGAIMEAPPIIGPYNEGTTLILYCDVTGGRPPPDVEWLINKRFAVSESVRKPGGIVRSKLIVEQLTREHLNAVFQCRASNFNKSTPISSTVTLDMNFHPMNVSIQNRDIPLSEGATYELVCESWGSRPPARISWWKGGTIELKDAKVSTTSDHNVTTSVLRYRAKLKDNQKYLTCRAENPLIPGSVRESGLQFSIQYKPVVTLQMGSTLDPDGIKEKDDVYFDCHINANPAVQKITWLHNGMEVSQDVTRGVILQNQSLVLQKVGRRDAGLYTCKAENSEGEGESNSVSLIVQYKPYCKQPHQTIYGTALHEAATVTCEVEALPGPVAFSWTFNNSSENVPIPPSAVTSQALTSVARYAPKSHLDYGTLLCWPRNSIGKQNNPCAFAIIPAGPPDAPENCSIVNQTSEAIQVQCSPGFNGGLPQTFYMEVYDSLSQTLYRNLSSTTAKFLLHSLRPGVALQMVTYAANNKGRSKEEKLETSTLKVAEKRTSPPSILSLPPVLGIVVGIVSLLLAIALVILVVTRLRKPHDVASASAPLRERHTDDSYASGQDSKLSSHVYKNETTFRSVPIDTEEVNPDVIPQKKDTVAFQESVVKSSIIKNHLASNDDQNILTKQNLDTPVLTMDDRYQELQRLVQQSALDDCAPHSEYSSLPRRKPLYSSNESPKARNGGSLIFNRHSGLYEAPVPLESTLFPYQYKTGFSITPQNKTILKVPASDNDYDFKRSSIRMPLLNNPSESSV